ncbi:hypothetical protein B0H17DRAFT_939911, partial [Mycena rosella]
RSSPVHFYHIKAHSVNHHNDAADAAAKAGADLPLPTTTYTALRAPPPTGCSQVPTTTLKVFCDIPESPAQPAVPSHDPLAPNLSSGSGAHRKRNPLQRAHLKRLTDAASNSAAFWNVYRGMADPKPRAPAVSLADLAACFEKRMNTAQSPPPEFNMEYKRAVEERAQNIPFPSGDPNSEDQTFNERLSEEDIEWAKEHLESHCKSSVGLDRRSYQEVAEIENDVLCKLINECGSK